MLVLIALSFVMPRLVDRAVETYTDTAPSDVPAVRIDRAEQQSVEDRVERFGDTLQDGTAREPLTLTEREINGWLAVALDSDDVPGMYVDLRPSQIRAHVSLRLHQELPLGPWSRDLTGRYLNGLATFSVDFRDGTLNFTLEDFEVKDRRLPRYAVKFLNDALQKQAFLNDSDAKAFFAYVGSVQIDDDRIVIRPNSRAPAR